jgi:hypothetical protein
VFCRVSKGGRLLELLQLRHGVSSGTQRKGKVHSWKLLSSNGSEDVTVDTSVRVTGNCEA